MAALGGGPSRNVTDSSMSNQPERPDTGADGLSRLVGHRPIRRSRAGTWAAFWPARARCWSVARLDASLALMLCTPVTREGKCGRPSRPKTRMLVTRGTGSLLRAGMDCVLAPFGRYRLRLAGTRSEPMIWPSRL